jgi:hypothetical protein
MLSRSDPGGSVKIQTVSVMLDFGGFNGVDGGRYFEYQSAKLRIGFVKCKKEKRFFKKSPVCGIRKGERDRERGRVKEESEEQSESERQSHTYCVTY